jgi:phenylalanyl-tRNA synthetase beta chain
LSVEPVAHPFLRAGTAACWRLGPSIVGYVGELSEEVRSQFGLRSNPCVCEIDLDGLVPAAILERKFRDLPRHPAIVRDLAIVVDRTVSWEQVLTVVQQAGAEHLEGVTFGEVYTGKQVARGKKSVFFSLVFRADDRTLTHDEVSVGQDAIVAALAEQLGATLRA